MAIILAVISILALSGTVFAANKVLSLRMCPICAGVAGTWLLMLLLRFLGYPISTLVLAMLMGGSVVGIAYSIEKRVPKRRSALLFKMFFMPTGFIAAYGIVEANWVVAAVAIAAASVVSAALLLGAPQSADSGNSGELEKKLEDCC